MAAALSHNDPVNDRPATWAGLPRLSENLEMVTVAAPVALDGCEIGLATAQGCPGILQPFSQYMPDGAMQALDLPGRERIGGPQRMDARRPQGFIHIDVPQSCQEVLIQKQGFDLTMLFRQHGCEPCGRKIIGQGFGAHCTEKGDEIVDQIEASEFARIVEKQPASIVQPQGGLNVTLRRRRSIIEDKPPGHAQVDNHMPWRIELKDNVFGTTPNGVDAFSPNRLNKRLRADTVHCFGPVNPDVLNDMAAYPGRLQIVDDGLDFR